MAGTHTVEADVGVAGLRGDTIKGRHVGGDAGAEGGERGHVAAVGGELDDLLTGDQGADLVGLRLRLEGIGLDGDSLAAAADGQGDIFLERLGDVHDDAVLLIGLKAGGADGEIIVANIEAGEVEDAGAVGHGGVGIAGLKGGDADVGVGNDGAGGIGHDSCNLAAALCVGDANREQGGYENQESQ